LEASHKYVPRKEWEGFDAQVRGLYPRMARISITPEWAKLVDFETTLPQGRRGVAGSAQVVATKRLYGRSRTLIARRSSIARYASATWSRGRVRSKTLPGLIFPFHTISISSGRNRRTGAGPPWRWMWEKNSSWPSSSTPCGTPTDSVGQLLDAVHAI